MEIAWRGQLCFKIREAVRKYESAGVFITGIDTFHDSEQGKIRTNSLAITAGGGGK